MPATSDDVATYKAIMCERISPTAEAGIDATVLRDLPRAKILKPKQLRVKVRAAALNFPELLMMQSKYQVKPPLPFVLCTEGSGVVVEVGESSTQFKTGDRVFFKWDQGCACEEIILPEVACLRLPDVLSFSQGAGFLMGYETGYHALVHRGHLQAGQWLLVTGAGGGMGVAAVQLGKALGAKVIAAASSDQKLEVCRRLGADHVVNYSKETLKDAVGRITGGAFCDVIYEPVGGDVFDEAIRCVTPSGYARLLVIGFASGRIPQMAVNQALIRRFDLVGCMVYGQLMREPKRLKEMRSELLKLASDGKLMPHVSAEIPMEHFKEAFSLMNERRVVGKCCIMFGEGSFDNSKL